MGSLTRTTAVCVAAAQTDQDRAAMIGHARAHVAWAMAAADAGEIDDVRVFLSRAAAALGVTEPSPLYIPPAGTSFARKHGKEAF